MESLAPPTSRAVQVTITTLDLVARLAFFAAAPLVIFIATLLVPITGTLVNLGIAVGVFFFAEAVRGHVGRHPWLRALVKKPLQFEAYYRKTPPRPFVYYVVYPLLFPYWMINAQARREFLLFKGYTFASLGILGAASLHQYFVKWRPELGPRAFFGTFALTLLVDVVLVMTVLMPMTTTVVSLHLEHRRRSLRAVVGVAFVSLALTTAFYLHKRHGIVSFATATRMSLRAKVAPKRSRVVMEKALTHAWASTFHGEGEFVPESKGEVEVTGEPIDEARATLGLLYRDDETYCFHLIAVRRKDRPRMLVLYGDPGWVKRPLVWLALDDSGRFLDALADLPPDGLRVMRRTASQ